MRRPVRPRAPDVRQEIGEHQLVKQMIAKMAAGHRDRAGCSSGGRLAQEPGPAQHPRDEPRQVARHRARGPERARRDPDPRRQRLLERVPGRALPAQLEGRRHLRGHEPAPHAHPGRLRPRLSRGPAAPLRAVAGPGLRAPDEADGLYAQVARWATSAVIRRACQTRSGAQRRDEHRRRFASTAADARGSSNASVVDASQRLHLGVGVDVRRPPVAATNASSPTSCPASSVGACACRWRRPAPTPRACRR